MPGYTLLLNKCISDFNYELQIVCSTNAIAFRNAYFSFLTQIAAAASTDLNALTIKGLGADPNIVVSMVINSVFLANSQFATDQENSIKTLL